MRRPVKAQPIELVFKGAVVVLSLLYLAASVVTGVSGDDAVDKLLWALLAGGASVSLLAGLQVIKRSPWLGAGLIAVPSIGVGVLLGWTIVAPAIGVLVMVLAIGQARGLARQRARA